MWMSSSSSKYQKMIFLIRKTKFVQTPPKNMFQTLFLPWFEMHVWCVCIELALVAQQVVTNNPIHLFFGYNPNHLFAKRKSSKTLYLLSNLAWILVLKKISETITIDHLIRRRLLAKFVRFLFMGPY